jgi:hypothetical protein
MITWIDSIIIATLVTMIIYLVYKFFKLRNLWMSLSDMYLQAMTDKYLLEQKIKELYQDIENSKLEQTDGFLKFVSDSRDWAFQYIEEVQSALSEFDKAVRPQLEWATTYGMVNGENAHTETLEKISEAYAKLKEVLPKETETPNN